MPLFAKLKLVQHSLSPTNSQETAQGIINIFRFVEPKSFLNIIPLSKQGHK
jgi:hypothetical protein